MSSRDRSRGQPSSASPHVDRRAGGESRNGSGTMPPLAGSSRAERFEDEKKRIINSCFSKKDSDGSTLESYITHIRITEDAAYPSSPPPTTSPPENKKPRAIIVSVRKSGRVRMHKTRENNDGSFSIGKTWMLDDLSRIQVFDHLSPSNHTEQQQKSWAADLGFIVTITKPYYWAAATSKERDFFIGSLVKIYKKYTGGKVPDLIGLHPSEKEALTGSFTSNSQAQSQFQSQIQPPPQLQAKPQDPRLMHLENKKTRSQSPSAAVSGRDQSPFQSLPPSREGAPESRRQPSREKFLQGKPSLDQMPLSPPPTGMLPRIPNDSGLQTARLAPQSPSVEQLPKKLIESPPTEELAAPSSAISEHQKALPTRTYKAMPPPAPSPSLEGGFLSSKPYSSSMQGLALTPKLDERPFAYNSNKHSSPDSGEVSPFSKPVQSRPTTSESSVPASLRPAFDRSASYDRKSTKSNEDGDDVRNKVPPVSREPPKIELPPSTLDIPQLELPKIEPISLNGDDTLSSRDTISKPAAPAEPLSKTESRPDKPIPPVTDVPTTSSNISSTSPPEPEPQTKSEPKPETKPEPEPEPEVHRPGLGPMMKRKGGAKDVANALRKAANAYNAFKPRAGGAAERLLAAKEKEKSEGPDGITGVVPAPSLRGATTETTAKPSTEPPPEVQVTESSIGKRSSTEKPTEPLPLKRKEMKPVQPPREDNTKKTCSALGIDSAILGGRGVEFDWLLTDIGWDGRLAKEQCIEALETDIRREIGRVQASSWLSQLQSSHDGRVDQLAKLFDRAMDECDELDGLLTLYSHELDTLSEDVHYIESQGQGLQTRLANQRLLQSELQAMVKPNGGSR